MLILDGDPQNIWANLTQKERDSFTSILKENKLSELVHEWLPWWSYKVGTKLNINILMIMIFAKINVMLKEVLDV